MSQIGSFTRGNDGAYAGTIKTLAIDAKARLVPSDPASTSDKAPDLRVIVSGVEIGAAWRRTSKDDRTYHSVKLDDPSDLRQPLRRQRWRVRTDLVTLTHTAASRNMAGRRGQRPVIMRSGTATKARKTAAVSQRLRIIPRYA